MLAIYVISLLADTERRRLIKSELDRLSIPFEFIDAVNGAELSDEFVSKLNFSGGILTRGFMPTKGELGCTLSHLKAYQLILERGQSWACILEDDVVLDNRIQNFYENFKIHSYQFNSGDLYLLGGQEGILDSRFISKSFFNFFYVGKEKFNKTIKSEKYLFRTCAYILSGELAENIIRLSSNIFLLADDWCFLAKHRVIDNIYLSDFVSHPVDLSGSNIEKERLKAIGALNNVNEIEELSYLTKLKKRVILKQIIFFKMVRTQLLRLFF